MTPAECHQALYPGKRFQSAASDQEGISGRRYCGDGCKHLSQKAAQTHSIQQGANMLRFLIYSIVICTFLYGR